MSVTSHIICAVMDVLTCGAFIPVHVLIWVICRERK